MPVTEKIKPQGISRKHLSFNPNQIGGSGGTSIYGTISEYDYDTAGETILAGNAVFFGADGKNYIASAASEGHSATTISADYGTTDSTIRTTRSRDVVIDNANFELGKSVWLIEPDINGINVSTTIPEFSTGTIIQKLGIAISTDTFRVEINESGTIE